MKTALSSRPLVGLHAPHARWADRFLDTVFSRGFLRGTIAFAVWNTVWLTAQVTLG